jgi:hypothetical protein
MMVAEMSDFERFFSQQVRTRRIVCNYLTDRNWIALSLINCPYHHQFIDKKTPNRTTRRAWMGSTGDQYQKEVDQKNAVYIYSTLHTQKHQNIKTPNHQINIRGDFHEKA